METMMKPEDLAPTLALADREERKRKRRQLEEEFRADLNSRLPSDRLARARGFGHQIMSIVNDFIPHACSEKALEALMISAYALDVEIVNVQPERDAERASALREAETAALRPQMIIIPKNQ
jgi:hypothetical protein